MSSASDTNQPEFTGIRAVLWPIHNHELKKFIPLALIMFCILFNYTILRDTKDTLVVNAGGAAVIPFLKGIAVTIAAIAFVIIYAKLSNILSREKLFYTIVTPFIAFFGLFGFVIYPMADFLHPARETIVAMHANYPALSGFIDIYAYWSYSVFYVFAEIWGSAILALAFWEFANHVVRFNESKRFYGLFAVIANTALIMSGGVVYFCSESIKNFLPAGVDAWHVSMYLLMGVVVAMGLFCMYIYRWMYLNVLNDKRYFDPEENAGKTKKKKSKPSLGESFKIIVQSPELALIAMLIMAYGVTINLVEVQWKEQLKIFYAGDKGGYNGFMGIFSAITGAFTIAFGLFVGSNIIRKFSWFTAAVITPFIILVGGALFFIFTCSENLVAPLLVFLKSTPVAVATFLGAAVVIVSKSVKYTLFDPTKEMAYIPLDAELKSKGKAAVDVIGGRLGKAGGGYVQMGLLMAFATKDVVAIAPYAFGTFALVCILWLYAVKGLSKKVAAAVKLREDERAAA
ncbi:MAG: Npt1/Npt2 family nucleotide transporter [Candidatus Paracaedibacteraceae bacterium]|nr:Npt1/Npt2 family nucleotide transporter [Candidatus Paracaedibacteraceae bacterium]